ncbi:MAG: ABC transporter substrate-binding protein, partial [Chloroflexota bacterium]
MAPHGRPRPRAALLVVAGLLAAACTPVASSNAPSSPVVASSGPGVTAGTSASAPASAATGGALAGPPQANGGTLSIAFNSDIQYFDPAKGYDVVSWPAERLIFEQLLQYDAGTKLIPLLADGMPQITNDGKTYTFKLHSGVKFIKPDGSVLRDLAAGDVVASINRVLDPKLKPSASPGSGFFGGIVGAADVLAGKAATASGIKAVDPATVEFDLVKADATFLNVLATPFASVVPSDTPHDAAQVASNPIGTGPYYLKSYTKGTAATFNANKSYWQQGQPYVDTIDFRVGVDDNAAIQQIQAGQL